MILFIGYGNFIYWIREFYLLDTGFYLLDTVILFIGYGDFIYWIRDFIIYN
jgi:hypothetical protein